MPTIDIDSDAAHDAAQRELAKPIYPKPSLTDRIGEWIDDLIYRLASEGASVPGGWVTLSVLGVLLVLAVLLAIRTARRAVRSNRSRPALFDSHDMSAAEHRAAAERCAEAGDWAAAIRHRLRAVARRLEETGVLDPVPGRTATELARDAGRELPHLNAELASAATAFNDVTYGERPGTETAYLAVADLDDHLGTRAVAPTTADAVAAAPDAWAEVR
ncbi:DUF4129 domain-containing protein [Mycolicibacterium flavescens]|uniref:Protein-glutamine gamma-glutamyltransferase-like C-terminal domain-containing protein n=1 Tax=Mycolicibacterium flavescens TaxID=1776 RepID=A0A1E3REX1_MYCFV|nr:DUF4129 domain-containing protein [Mycolicibacterium flavescens]MCV7280898.1 DUF4129 domain-containing protein [Mycolicibacterium flavescens]ODQ88389.1 hypothetical protein BHQ18_19835 [Mycolicibacterium flavescens]